MRKVSWREAEWLNPPPTCEESEAEDLVVSTAAGSDFWRHTAYGFVRDDGHALLTPLADATAVEVSFQARFRTRYDQAGIMVRADQETWIKAGVEFTDGVPHVGAVVTRSVSDWSLSPAPDWADRLITVRVSRVADAVTVQARCETGPWQLVRVAPWPPGTASAAGPYCCSPGRSGLHVRFSRFATGSADPGFHATP
jgi:regulation of enolase protein 1 (concanavalin A-like superfamily)